MVRVKIITDSNSGISQDEAKELGIFVIPMPFTVDGEEYLEDISITQEKFFEFLNNDADVKTSQPSRFYLEELFDNLLTDNDEIVYIPMSSGLSGTCENATALAQNYEGKVFVVNNTRISVTQKQSVLDAIKLAGNGKSGSQIKQILEEKGKNQSIYIMVGTLKYLKKGGRISGAAATLGSLLKIKPILFSNGGKFDKFAIALNTVQAKRKMIDQVKQELSTKFSKSITDGTLVISVAHTNNYNEAVKFKEEILKEFPNVCFKFVDSLSLSVACHIGPGALAIAVCE